LADFVGRVRGLTERAARDGAELVQFPEYICVDLIPELVRRSVVAAEYDLREALSRLPDLNAELFEELASVASSCGVVLGAGTYLEQADDGKAHNAAQVFTPDGRHMSQAKMHIAYEMVANAADVSAGAELAVWEAGGARIVTLVCYDAQFPESGRAVLDHAGAVDLMLVPGCALEPWGITRMRTAAAARAMESFAFVVTAHLVGVVPNPREKPISFYGESAVFGPASRPFSVGGVVADSGTRGETIVMADLDISVLRQSRAAGFPKAGDRRPSLPVRQV